MKNHSIQQAVSQRKTASGTQHASAGEAGASLAPPNHTGLPDALKTGIESLSGMSLDDVRVHANSPKPTQLNALAYAQGSDIHLAPGQEQHLPHEAWHVVQQKQGRVSPTMQMKQGIQVNDDSGLEHEADVMGNRAFQLKPVKSSILGSSVQIGQQNTTSHPYNPECPACKAGLHTEAQGQSALDVVQLAGKGGKKKAPNPPTGNYKPELGLAKKQQHHDNKKYAKQTNLQSKIYMENKGKMSKKDALREAKKKIKDEKNA